MVTMQALFIGHMQLDAVVLGANHCACCKNVKLRRPMAANA